MQWTLNYYHMKKIIFIIAIFITSASHSQEKRFEFESLDVRTPNGWQILPVQGEVVFYEDEVTNTISIITPSHINLMYVKSRLMFVKEYNFLYTLVDDYDNESNVRIVLENRGWDYIDFYFYSDRLAEKYFRLCLKRCK